MTRPLPEVPVNARAFVKDYSHATGNDRLVAWELADTACGMPAGAWVFTSAEAMAKTTGLSESSMKARTQTDKATGAKVTIPGIFDRLALSGEWEKRKGERGRTEMRPTMNPGVYAPAGATTVEWDAATGCATQPVAPRNGSRHATGEGLRHATGTGCATQPLNGENGKEREKSMSGADAPAADDASEVLTEDDVCGLPLVLVQSKGAEDDDSHTAAAVSAPSSQDSPKAKTKSNPLDAPGGHPAATALAADFAASLAANGLVVRRAPEPTDEWRKAMRLLLDKDGVAEDDIRRVLAWTHRDAFWSTNVLSPVKFRIQYDRLVLDMRKPSRKSNASTRGEGGRGEWTEPDTTDTPTDVTEADLAALFGETA